jgi:hypothetical protein
MSTLEELFQQVERTLRDNEAAREASRRHTVQRQAELRESKIKVDQAVKRLRRAGLLK